MNERLGVLGQLIAVLSKNRYDPPALPRPETAYERVRRDFENERHVRLTKQLLPDG